MPLAWPGVLLIPVGQGNHSADTTDKIKYQQKLTRQPDRISPEYHAVFPLGNCKSPCTIDDASDTKHILNISHVFNFLLSLNTVRSANLS